MDLYQNLDNLCIRLNEEYYINSGGCCLVASYIAKCLEKHHIRFKVIFYDHYLSERSKISLRRKVKEGDLDSFNHYAIKVSNHIINGGEFQNDRRYRRIEVGCITSEDLLNLYDNGYWNSCYDNDNDEKVYNKITKCIDDYFRRRKS